jgi:hypothetical protein
MYSSQRFQSQIPDLRPYLSLLRRILVGVGSDETVLKNEKISDVVRLHEDRFTSGCTPTLWDPERGEAIR